jgi:methylated-DNA-[protein]-cysteine S-methyltransferase
VSAMWWRQESPIGMLTVLAGERGVQRIEFGSNGLDAEAEVAVGATEACDDEVAVELDEYFAGRRRRFDLPLDRSLSHGYRRVVLEALSDVPFGDTVSYKDLAVRTGNPGASRAVGGAMATNPIPIVVPCHRVLRSGGALGGYGGGVETKVWLLRHEGALLG